MSHRSCSPILWIPFGAAMAVACGNDPGHPGDVASTETDALDTESVDTVCEPTCGAKECGDDGCGGQCGTCPRAAPMCIDGSCAAPIPGDSCANPVVIDGVPYAQHYTTDGLHDTAHHGACGLDPLGSGAGAPDLFFAFTAPLAGVYSFNVIPELLYVPAISLAAECNEPIASTECLTATRSEDASKSAYIGRYLEQGERVLLVVDGSDSSQRGAFTLYVDRTCDGSACKHGASCQDPILVERTPFHDEAWRPPLETNYQVSRCPGLEQAFGRNVPDRVYQFTPTVSGRYEFGSSTGYLVTDCAAIDATCVASFPSADYAPIAIPAFLQAGTTYYFIAEIPDSNGFALTRPGLGSTCDDPFPVSALPFTAAGAFDALTSVPVRDDGSLMGWPGFLYRFVPTKSGRVSIVGAGDDPDGVSDAGEVVLDVYAGCPSIGNRLASQWYKDGLVLDVEQGMTYFIFVGPDGWPSAYDFTLTVGPAE